LTLQLFVSLTPSSESLLLRPIVRTRFQFVVLTGVAVEMNDFFGSLARFGHTRLLRPDRHEAIDVGVKFLPLSVRIIAVGDTLIRPFDQSSNSVSVCVRDPHCLNRNWKSEGIDQFALGLDRYTVDVLDEIGATERKPQIYVIRYSSSVIGGHYSTLKTFLAERVFALINQDGELGPVGLAKQVASLFPHSIVDKHIRNRSDRNDARCNCCPIVFRHSALPSETIRVALVFWLASAEAPASPVASASSYRFSEYVGILAIVLTELKFVQIERQVFLADVVVGADDSTLQQAPKTLDGICVNEAAHILATTMSNDTVRVLVSQSKQPITGVFIGSDQINFATHGLSHKTIKRWRISILDHLADDIPFTTDRADDGYLVSVVMARPVLALVGVPILVLAADERFVHFHDTHELLEIVVSHSRAQSMTDVPSGMQRRPLAKIHAPDLPRRNTLQTLQHRVENLEPCNQRHVRILEHRADQNRKPIGRLAAFLADPMKRLGLERVHFFVLTARALYAIRPSAIRKELTAGRFIWEGRHELLESHHA
jgi:hypothetical protein